MTCNTCGKEYSADCDYQQGRCPHHPAMINIQPRDPSRRHFYVSLVKSVVRIAAGGSLIYGAIAFAGIAFIFAELLGVVEEIV